jgi:hypothetical protein
MISLFKKSLIYIYSLLIASILFGAIIPHQGRITIESLPFSGVGKFKFALVDQFGKVRWNHEDGDGVPLNSISLPVSQGFYNCKLGDVSFPGMSPLPDDLFSYDDPLRLRIWFSDGNSVFEQLGPDQLLLVAPYAITTPWTKTDEVASLLSDELDEQSNDRDTTSLTLIERIVTLGSNTLTVSDEDFNGSISLSMLGQDVLQRLASLDSNTTKLDGDIIALASDLNNHKIALIERGNLAGTLISELDSLALANKNYEIRINDSEDNITNLEEEQKAHALSILSLEGNTTKIIQDLATTNQNLADYKATPITKSQLDNSLNLELNNTQNLNNDQQDRLNQLDKNISDLSNREIARQIQLNDFESDLTDIISKHQEQSEEIVEFKRDLALHNTKDGIQDTYIDEINDEIKSLKDSDEFTDSEIESINEEITGIMIIDEIQDANLTKNKTNISNLTTDLSSLDANFSAFKVLVEKYLMPEITSGPKVAGSLGPIDASAGDDILIEIEAEGRRLTYQWWFSKEAFNGGFDDYVKLDNTDSKVYPIQQANASEDSGKYKVEVSNEFGETTSSAITIHIE